MILPYIKAFQGEVSLSFLLLPIWRLDLFKTAFFDVPLHMNFSQASKQRSRYDLRHILKDTVVDIKPNDAVTFVDNHE